MNKLASLLVLTVFGVDAIKANRKALAQVSAGQSLAQTPNAYDDMVSYTRAYFAESLECRETNTGDECWVDLREVGSGLEGNYVSWDDQVGRVWWNDCQYATYYADGDDTYYYDCQEDNAKAQYWGYEPWDYGYEPVTSYDWGYEWGVANGLHEAQSGVFAWGYQGAFTGQTATIGDGDCNDTGEEQAEGVYPDGGACVSTCAGFGSYMANWEWGSGYCYCEHKGRGDVTCDEVVWVEHWDGGGYELWIAIDE